MEQPEVSEIMLNIILGSPSKMAGSGALTGPLQDIMERVGGADKPGRRGRNENDSLSH